MEFLLDCKKLEIYINRYSENTRFGDLTRDEQASILPELGSMGAIELASFEASDEFEKLKKVKIEKIFDMFCIDKN